MANESARMTPDRFEDAMERSFLIWLQTYIPEISIDTNSTLVPGASGLPIINADGTVKRYDFEESIPVQVVSTMPEEFYNKQRKTHAIIDVNFTRVDTEGYKLGNEVGGGMRPEGSTEYNQRSIPWQYVLEINLNTYTSSGLERAKLDGLIRRIVHGTRTGNTICPVYQWVSDTSQASAFSTGAAISFYDQGNARTIHDTDYENYDFISAWTLQAKCPYVIDSITDLVSSIAVTSELNLLV